MSIQVTPVNRSLQSALFLVGLCVLAFGIIYSFVLRESLYLPIILDSGIYIVFLSRVISSPKIIPLWDFGFLFSSAVLLYSLLPPMLFLARGMVFSIDTDNRLYALSPSESDLTDHALLYTLFLAVFCAAYAALISRRPSGRLNPSIGAYGASKTVRLLLMALVLVSIAIRFFDTPETGTYGEANKVRAEQSRGRSTVINQVISVASGAGLAAKIALLLLLMSGAAKVGKFFVGVWLAFEIVQAVMRLGGRSEVVILLLTLMLAYSRFVRPLTWVAGMACLTALLVGFSVFGWARYMSDAGGRAMSFVDSGMEFEGIFLTSYDLTHRAEMNLLPERPWTFYFADILSVIPSQLIPGEAKKTSGGDWYADMLGGTESGLGYGFGVVSEAACGLGAIEIVLRAIALGIVLSWLRNKFLDSSMAFISTFYYVYCLVNCFMLFRISTFSLIGYCYLYVSPVALVVVVFGRMRQKRVLDLESAPTY